MGHRLARGVAARSGRAVTRGRRSERRRARRSAWFAAIRIALRWLGARVRGRTLVCMGLTEHFGDLIAGEPISRQIKSAADGRVDLVWVTSERYAEVPRLFAAVDAVISVRNLGAWIALRPHLVADRVLDLHLHHRRCGVTGWSLENPSADPSLHADNYYAHTNLIGLQCANAGLERIDDGPRLRLPRETRPLLPALPPRYVVFHGRSNEEDREWDPDKWRGLAERLMEMDDLAVIEVGTDRPLLAPSARVISLVGRLTLTQLCVVISGCRLFVGVDSGPAHAANALDVPALVLMGWYRHYRRYLPYSGRLASQAEGALIRHDGPLRDLAVDRVSARAVALLEAPASSETRAAPACEGQIGEANRVDARSRR